MAKTKTTKPQTTIVSVAVTTAGPVPMKYVREWLKFELDWVDFESNKKERGMVVTKVTVKRDANIERPRR